MLIIEKKRERNTCFIYSIVKLFHYCYCMFLSKVVLLHILRLCACMMYEYTKSRKVKEEKGKRDNNNENLQCVNSIETNRLATGDDQRGKKKKWCKEEKNKRNDHHHLKNNQIHLIVVKVQQHTNTCYQHLKIPLVSEHWDIPNEAAAVRVSISLFCPILRHFCPFCLLPDSEWSSSFYHWATSVIVGRVTTFWLKNRCVRRTDLRGKIEKRKIIYPEQAVLRDFVRSACK